MLAECAAECETFCGRLFVPKTNGRTITTILQIDSAPLEPVSLLPRWPDVAGVTLAASEVPRWVSGAWVSAPASLRPAGRIALDSFTPGEYQFTVTAAPAASIPAAFVEGVSRLYAARTTTRPGDQTNEYGQAANLAGLLLRSGAGEVLRQLRRIG